MSYIVEIIINCDYFMSNGEADYNINNHLLENDLGVTFDPGLNFYHCIYCVYIYIYMHIYEIASKATTKYIFERSSTIKIGVERVNSGETLS